MPTYARETSVDSATSRAEIERTLDRWGADQFMYGTQPGEAIVGFRIKGRVVRLRLAMPDKNADEFRLTPSRGFERTAEQQRLAYEQAVRQRWRALALVIKAKLEAVEAGISTVEAEFLADTLLPSGDTVGQWIEPQVREAVGSGVMPSAIPGLPSGLKMLPAANGRRR